MSQFSQDQAIFQTWDFSVIKPGHSSGKYYLLTIIYYVSDTVLALYIHLLLNWLNERGTVVISVQQIKKLRIREAF